MSWKIQGNSVAFPKAAALTTGTYQVGDLVGLNTDSQIVASGALIWFPLMEKFSPVDGDKIACVQLDGVAMVKITTITSVDVGSRLMSGGSNGAVVATAGSSYIGYALQKPTVAGQIIPVLLVKGTVQTA